MPERLLPGHPAERGAPQVALEAPSPVRGQPGLTAETFHRMLAWLAPDRDTAGQRYETIRLHLIKIFVCRGCPVPEELADETFNRVAGKLDQIVPTYVGNPALYFYGVADKIFLEFTRRRPVVAQPPPAISSDEAERRYQCLERCMQGLSAGHRQLILAYYGYGQGNEGKRGRVERRKALAGETGLAANALWVRVHRIRASLGKCVRQCIERSSLRAAEFTSWTGIDSGRPGRKSD